MSNGTDQSRKLGVVILCGGQSRRFGSPKAAVLVEGLPLVERTGIIAEKLTSRLVLVGNLPDSLPTTGKRISDLEPGGGPLQGLLAGAAHFPGADLLVLSTDLPLLTVAHLKALLEVPANALVYFTSNRGQPSPLPAFYRREVMNTLIAAHEKGIRSLFRALHGVETACLQEETLQEEGLDPRGFYDFDTPADWEQLASILRAK